jgi:hypothetical protein
MNWDYIAGFTDGEGYIGVVGKGPRISWGQTDRRPLIAIKNFLEGKGFHPHLNRVGRKEIWMLGMGRRAEILEIVKILKPRLIRKVAACEYIESWHNDNPPKANMKPISLDEFDRLYKERYTLSSIARLMGYSLSTISRFSNRYGYSFNSGRHVDGKRLPALTKDERLRKKRINQRVKLCPTCGALIYKDSALCRPCYLLKRNG